MRMVTVIMKIVIVMMRTSEDTIAIAAIEMTMKTIAMIRIGTAKDAGVTGTTMIMSIITIIDLTETVIP